MALLMKASYDSGGKSRVRAKCGWLAGGKTLHSQHSKK